MTCLIVYVYKGNKIKKIVLLFITTACCKYFEVRTFHICVENLI